MARVLIIEDEPTIAMILKEVLEEEGHDVTTLHDGAEGLKLLRSGFLPDIMLVDLFLAGKRGSEIVEEIRSGLQLQQLPIVLVTGAVPRPEDFPPEGSYQALISKPFELSDIINAVARFTQDVSAPPDSSQAS